ncbi:MULTISPECIES: S24 family peptidase [Eubacterium]|uniref:S24 family peptidase n=1 Tax=Eubacterium TaxID=1730 RepID=UPI001D8BD8FD|nr:MULTISPECIES: S24 family peptidase [Eubacterium]MBS4857129.1 helix-turn-helix domain-containing protein [Eubacterium limosum]MBS5284697.1 helix-turn-helix domain-containing protein [Clostridiales bacterium]
MEFYEILEDIMSEKDMSIPDVSRATGISDSTLRSIINRKTKSASLEVAFKISKGLNVSLERLNGDAKVESKKLNFFLESFEIDHIKKYRDLDEYGRKTIDLILERELDRYKQFQQQQTEQHKAELQVLKEESEEQLELYARRIRRGGVANNAPPIPKKEHKMTKLNHFEGAYGAGGGQINNNATMITIEVSEDDVPEGADTTIDIAGDSMEPTLSDGDVVYVQHINQLEIGDIGVFYLDGQNFIKEYGGDELISHNPEYAPIQISEFSTFVIQGKVLGKKIEGFVEL